VDSKSFEVCVCVRDRDEVRGRERGRVLSSSWAMSSDAYRGERQISSHVHVYMYVSYIHRCTFTNTYSYLQLPSYTYVCTNTCVCIRLFFSSFVLCTCVSRERVAVGTHIAIRSRTCRNYRPSNFTRLRSGESHEVRERFRKCRGVRERLNCLVELV